MPTRVYARPLVLRTGLAMDAQTLKTELDAASYRDGDGKRDAGDTYTERLRSSLMALISIFLRPILAVASVRQRRMGRQ